MFANFVFGILCFAVAGFCLGFYLGRKSEAKIVRLPPLPEQLPFDRYPLRIKAILRDWGCGQPHGIGEIAIANDATGTEEIGNYQVQLVDHKPNQDPTLRYMIVKNHRRADGAWALVAQILKEAGFDGTAHGPATRVPGASD